MRYEIRHHYDIGDQSVTVESAEDPTDAAIYCQFVAEDAHGPSTLVSNLGIAAALVQFYGCRHAARSDEAVIIDMHVDREKRVGHGYERLIADTSLGRAGLADYLKTHIDP